MWNESTECTVGRLAAALLLVATTACAEERALNEGRGLIRGRVTDVSGAPVAALEVTADGATARTDSRGRFQLMARVDREVRVAVKGDMYTTAELPVSVDEGAPANVEVAVKPRRTLRVMSAAAGGRLESDDGFALELPTEALTDEAGARVDGEVEVRYALVNRPSEVTAAPGRMQSSTNKGGLDGYGMAEVSFYKDGRRLKLTKAMTVEIPLYEGHELREGESVDSYQLTEDDLRWSPRTQGTVRGNRVVLSAMRDEWLGAAKALPAEGCVKGRVAVGASGKAANTTIRAARGRGLALIQAETHEDGSFCLPVTTDDDWRVSTFYDDGAQSYGLAVDLRSENAAGMCGGSDGCKDVGDVSLAAVE